MNLQTTVRQIQNAETPKDGERILEEVLYNRTFDIIQKLVLSGAISDETASYTLAFYSITPNNNNERK